MEGRTGAEAAADPRKVGALRRAHVGMHVARQLGYRKGGRRFSGIEIDARFDLQIEHRLRAADICAQPVNTEPGLKIFGGHGLGGQDLVDTTADGRALGNIDRDVDVD